jgi:hypothetical protein
MIMVVMDDRVARATKAPYEGPVASRVLHHASRVSDINKFTT